MSSFKRKATGNAQQLPIGARQSQSTPSISLISSGIPSLDDVLGGGCPLGCVLIVLTPDLHSAWGLLIQRYFIAQGISGGQQVCVVSNQAEIIVNGCMWRSGSRDSPTDNTLVEPADNEESSDSKIKIAWRYEKMKQFQTTVSTSTSPDYFCDVFDLTVKIPETTVSQAINSGQLSSVEIPDDNSPFTAVLDRIREIVAEGQFRSQTNNTQEKRRPLRLSIPDLGGPQWGDPSPTDILRFLHSLRLIVRSSDVAVLVTLPPHLSNESPIFPSTSLLSFTSVKNWVEKLGFLTDACVSLSSFGSDPSLASLFKTYHGAIRIVRAPSLHTFLPPSHKHSVLRGLNAVSSASQHNSSTNSGTGSGENNLAFKCTRKRFVIETLHLDAEGGVGERRTSAPPSANVVIRDRPGSETQSILGVSTSGISQQHTSPTGILSNQRIDRKPVSSSSAVSVEYDDSGTPSPTSVTAPSPTPASTSVFAPDTVESPISSTSSPLTSRPKKKPQKRVAFHSDRPDLYDF